MYQKNLVKSRNLLMLFVVVVDYIVIRQNTIIPKASTSIKVTNMYVFKIYFKIWSLPSCRRLIVASINITATSATELSATLGVFPSFIFRRINSFTSIWSIPADTVETTLRSGPTII